jgi:hypothetical protein
VLGRAIEYDQRAGFQPILWEIKRRKASASPPLARSRAGLEDFASKFIRNQAQMEWSATTGDFYLRVGPREHVRAWSIRFGKRL